MGYRSEWLSHAGNGTRHMEPVLYALEKEISPKGPIRLLLVGVENGGSLEVWQRVLPEGSEVVGVDIEPLCGELGLPVLVGDATDKGWCLENLGREPFDVVINSTGWGLASLWPWVRAGGLFLWEGYDIGSVVELVDAVADGYETWLPSEEIMRVSVWHSILIVEKRYPKVIPYLEVFVGNFFDVVPEEDLIERGARRIVME